MALATETAAARSSKSPNTVAPEPDMRARRQPSAARIDASASPIAGASAIAAVSRSLRAPAMAATSRGRSSAGSIAGCGEAVPRSPRAERPEHRRGRDRNAGVREHGKERRQAQGRTQHLAGPGHHAGARFEGTPARRRRCPSPPPGSPDRRGARPLRRARSRSAAAASAEPPPRPAATGRRFVRWKAPVRSPGTRRASARAALRTRLSASPPAAFAVGPETDRLSAPGSRLRSSPVPAKATRLSRA